MSVLLQRMFLIMTKIPILSLLYLIDIDFLLYNDKF